MYSGQVYGQTPSILYPCMNAYLRVSYTRHLCMSGVAGMVLLTQHMSGQDHPPDFAGDSQTPIAEISQHHANTDILVRGFKPRP